MKYKLVMLDVDGTLLSDTLQVSPRVKTAIRQTQELGVIVSLCTGRLAITCEQLVQELALNCYSVYYSGSLLKNFITGSTLNKHALASDIGRELVAFAREHQIYLEVHTEDAYFYEVEGEYSAFQRDTLGVAPIHADLFDITANQEILKLQFVSEADEDLKKLEALQQQDGKIALSSGKAPSHPMTFVNVVPGGISKGSGVREIAASLGIPLDQVIAVGDSSGDIEALEAAGLGVAMENSVEELKQHADYITSSVWEDGVAEVLEKFILTENL